MKKKPNTYLVRVLIAAGVNEKSHERMREKAKRTGGRPKILTAGEEWFVFSRIEDAKNFYRYANAGPFFAEAWNQLDVSPNAEAQLPPERKARRGPCPRQRVRRSTAAPRWT